MATTAPTAAQVSGARRIAFTILVVLLGLGTAVGMGGVFNLVGALFGATGDSPGGDVHRIHDLAWGITTAVILGAAFLVQVRRPERKVAAMQQALIGVGVGLLGLALGEALSPELGAEGAPVIVSAALVAITVLVAALHPARQRVLRAGPALSLVLAPAALIAAIPLTAYALAQAGLQRAGSVADEHVLFVHYADMTTVALAIPLLGLLAATKTPGWRIPAWSAGLAAILLGVGCVMYPTHASSLGMGWGSAAIAGGLAFIAAAEWEARRVPFTT